MANKKLVNQYKAMYQQINQITPQVYAGIALALHRRYGWGYKRINDLFSESQAIWNECVAMGADMARMCEEETGIEIQRKIEERT